MAYFRFKCGKVIITSEGSEDFLEHVLPKLVSDIGEQVRDMAEDVSIPDGVDGQESLKTFVSRQSEDTQVSRFLAAAAWLQVHQSGRLTTTAVAHALRESKLPKLNNASDSLNRNIDKGFCERRNNKGPEFFVTPEGLKEVGLDGVI